MSPGLLALEVSTPGRVTLDLPASRAMPRRLRLVCRDGCLIAYLFTGSRKGSTKELVCACAAVGSCRLISSTLNMGSAFLPLTEAESSAVAATFRAAGLRILRWAQ